MSGMVGWSEEDRARLVTEPALADLGVEDRSEVFACRLVRRRWPLPSQWSGAAGVVAMVGGDLIVCRCDSRYARVRSAVARADATELDYQGSLGGEVTIVFPDGCRATMSPTESERLLSRLIQVTESDPDGRFLAYAPNSERFFLSRKPDELGSARSGTIKLMPDYGVDVPLWGDWRSLELEAALVTRMRQWQSTFDTHFSSGMDDGDGGWDDPQVAAEWAEEGGQLADELRLAAGEGVVIEVDLWPMAPRS